MVSARTPRAVLPLLALVVALSLLTGAAVGQAPVADRSPAGTVTADTAAPGAALLAQTDPDDGRLTVTGVTVSPGTPTVEDPITFAVDLRVSAGSPSAVAVDRIAVREIRPGQNRTVATATDPGTLSPGDTLTVPVTGRFEEPGERRLVVVAVGTDSDGNRTRVRRPLSLVVERAPPRLDVSVNRTVAQAPATVSVAVSNPTNVEVRDVILTVDGAAVTPIDGRRSIPDLAAGERVTVELSVRPETVGDSTLTVTASYAAGSGVRATTERATRLQVVPVDRDVGVRVGPADDDPMDGQLGGVGAAVGGVLGGRSTQPEDDERRRSEVDVTVTNFGNVPADEVVVTPRVGDRRLPRRAVPNLAPGESASVTIDLSTVARPGTVEFAVDYRAADEAGTASATFDYRPATGRVRLTGVDLGLEDGQLRITGNAGNTGEAPVRGVVVSVGESATVAPAYPRRSYFVGTVEGSEFAPFELTADVDTENVSTVPVRVSYRVDGVQYNRTLDLAYDESIEDDGGSGGRPWALYAGGAVALLLVGAGAVVLLRRRGE